MNAEQFLKLVNVIITTGSTTVAEVAVAVAGCLSKLLEIFPVLEETVIVYFLVGAFQLTLSVSGGDFDENS